MIRTRALALAIALLAAAPSSVWAAHTLDTTQRHPATATTLTTASDPITVNYTCGAGTTVFVVGIAVAGGTNRVGSAPTYNGVTMTQANSTQKAASSPECSIEVWYILGSSLPTPGSAYTLSIPNNTTSRTMKVMMASFKAATGYISALDVANGTNNTAADPSTTVVTTVNGDAIFHAACDGLANWSVATGNRTLVWAMDLGSWGGGIQYYLQSTAGSTAMTFTSSSDDWGTVAVAFKEVADPNATAALTTKLATSARGDLSATFTQDGTASPSTTTTYATSLRGTLGVGVGVTAPLTNALATAYRGNLSVIAQRDETLSLATSLAPSSPGSLLPSWLRDESPSLATSLAPSSPGSLDPAAGASITLTDTSALSAPGTLAADASTPVPLTAQVIVIASAGSFGVSDGASNHNPAWHGEIVR